MSPTMARAHIKKAVKDRRRGQLEMKAARRDCLDRVSVGAHEEPDERSRVIAVLRCLPRLESSWPLSMHWLTNT